MIGKYVSTTYFPFFRLAIKNVSIISYMKRIVFVVTLIGIFVAVGIFFAGGEAKKQPNYLRIHIRANSNTDVDQGVKFAVKQSVVNFLTPKIASVNSVEEAFSIVKSELSSIEKISNEVLVINGFTYMSRARLCEENFPTRSYENLTLEEGIYDALIIELGDGTGDNWWCVVYPPLCFVSKSDSDSDQIVYKSIVYETIHRLH